MKIDYPSIYFSEVTIQSSKRYYLAGAFVSARASQRDIIATGPPTKEIDPAESRRDADGPPTSFPQRPAINSMRGGRAGSISIEASSVVEVLSNYRSYRRYENRSAAGLFAHYIAPYRRDGCIYCVPGVRNDRQVEIGRRQWRCEQRKQSCLTFMNRIPAPRMRRCIQIIDKGVESTQYRWP